MIEFKVLRFKNVLSTGNAFTTIRLNQSSNTLIVGKNGDGKSTMIDALTFALFGRPFRKIKKDQLINSVNQGGLETEIEFSVNQIEYVVRRGLKPAFFEIYKSGQLLDQLAAAKDYQDVLERAILRFNYKSFTQIVLLGSSSFVPFMQLPVGTRREIIEDLLDIRVFSTMGLLLKERQSKNKAEIVGLERDHRAAKDLLKVHQAQAAHDAIKEANTMGGLERDIASHQANIAAHQSSLTLAQEYASELHSQLLGDAACSANAKKADSINSDLNKKRLVLTAAIQFFDQNSHCPTCSQTIEETFRCAHLEEKRREHQILVDAISTLQVKRQEYVAQLKQFIGIRAKHSIACADVTQITQAIREETLAITGLRKTINTLTTAPTDREWNTSHEKIAAVEETIKTITTQYEVVQREKNTLDIAAIVLRDDGIKARIVKQYIPIINKLVNKYLALLDFFVSFELNENFEEQIRSRYRDDFTYESFSEGEKMRIDLAILFTWRAVAKLKNSASTNLLILDEVFDASLDAAGCDEFLKVIHALEECHVFVISHKVGLLLDRFKDVLRFEKMKNFSQLATA